MSRLTVRLPETLHHQLVRLAESEGVSLNQYIVYALTRQATSAYTVDTLPETTRDRQKESFNTLLQNLGQASPAEIEVIIAEREFVEPEESLTSEVISRLQERMSNKKLSR
ncbi:toxin-antitoxin system HicB family antitoxin [Chroococcidiopsis sp. FACHB-1243]|uniref:YlcI/YnfO family protein n=1 Tax=Chroococcidiopsis sp. [FACHB-1243] TaxID=2692781 RepID=UPI00177F920D|nr:YlcI/YnfO family protein [Chroococcidiopsis sp. [FACHB-1243]]MBD2309049.1 toxin-antitoxin system HicB family antitoxin [Chroococcidiopsis sp. [FACHB-1243]]